MMKRQLLKAGAIGALLAVGAWSALVGGSSSASAGVINVGAGTFTGTGAGTGTITFSGVSGGVATFVINGDLNLVASDTITVTNNPGNAAVKLVVGNNANLNG